MPASARKCPQVARKLPASARKCPQVARKLPARPNPKICNAPNFNMLQLSRAFLHNVLPLCSSLPIRVRFPQMVGWHVSFGCHGNVLVLWVVFCRNCNTIVDLSTACETLLPEL